MKSNNINTMNWFNVPCRINFQMQNDLSDKSIFLKGLPILNSGS